MDRIPLCCALVHERTGKAPNGHANPAGHHHVVVDVLPGNQKSQAAAQHPNGATRHVNAGKKPCAIQQHRPHEQGVQRDHQASSPRRRAKNMKADGLQPIQQRRFVEKRNAIDARRQPVTADPHPSADFGVAPFVWNGQRTKHRQDQQQGWQQPQAPALDARGFKHSQALKNEGWANHCPAPAVRQHRAGAAQSQCLPSKQIHAHAPHQWHRRPGRTKPGDT